MWNSKTPEKEKQFIEAYEQYSEPIFRHCYYRVFEREKAKDLVQETFFKTWKYLIKGNEIENIRAFLYRTANNIIIDESRKKKHVSLDAIMEKGFNPSIDTREADSNYFSAKEVVEVLHVLDEKYKDVIMMRYIDGFSTREIASIVGETEDNVYVRMHRGIKKVKELMAQQNHGNRKAI